jgi:hypothetical protein
MYWDVGLGLGLSYTPCISTLIQWFPDKKGTASGITIAGFGSGALVFTPLVQNLTKYFSKLPEYLGNRNDFVLNNIEGKLYVDINGSSVQVVDAIAADVAKLPYALQEGLYVVGSGSTGAAETLAILGAGYFSVMLLSAMCLRLPEPGYTPGTMPSLSSSSVPVVSKPVDDIPLAEAIRY